jgi:hypothetical protein
MSFLRENEEKKQFLAFEIYNLTFLTSYLKKYDKHYRNAVYRFAQKQDTIILL